MKKKYVKPSMTELEIFLEGGFMAGSVFEPGNKEKGVLIEGHQIGANDNYATDEPGIGDNTWD